MITVSLIGSNEEPIGVGLVFQLVSKDGEVIASAETDEAGVVTFDVDSTDLDEASIRFEPPPPASEEE